MVAIGHARSARQILVVDDEAHARRELATIVRGRGFDVVEAGSGQEALDAVKRSRISLILMDMDMPGLDGAMTSGLIKTDVELMLPPLIVALIPPGYVSRVTPMADAYLDKPIDADAVTRTIDACFDSEA